MTDRHDPLIDFVASVSGDAYLKVEEDLGEGYVRLRTSEAERRQAKHDIRRVEDVVVELLRNARDAHAQHIFVASSREGDERAITVIDDGVGVPEGMRDRIFEPRVTSKLDTMVMDRWGIHGRGMALFSVRSNVKSARIAASASHKGTSIAVLADTTDLAERADQSTWPQVERAENDLWSARGPHNIARAVVEFALEHPGLDVFFGTPTEVLATLHEVGRSTLDAADLLFVDDLSQLPVWQRPAAASDARELTDIAELLGIPVSERTAHRVLGGMLAAEPTVLARLLGEPQKTEQQESAPDIYRDRRGLKIHHSDLTAFRRDLTAAFDALAEKYYIHLVGEPKVTVGKDNVRVRFTIEKED